MSENVKLILTLIIGYLLGSISTGVIVSRVFGHKDIRSEGSGNSGTTNMLRVMGKKYALLTFAGDLFKGIAAVLIGKAWLGTQAGEIVGAFGAILGHNFPLYFGFKGGKGIATSFGCLLVVFPVQTLCAFGVFLLLVAATRYVSAGSLGAAVTLPFFIMFTTPCDSGDLGFDHRHLSAGHLAACAEHQAVNESHGEQNQSGQRQKSGLRPNCVKKRSKKERIRKVRSFLLCKSGFLFFRVFLGYAPPCRQTDHLPAHKIAGQQIGIKPQQLFNIRAVAFGDLIQRVAFLQAVNRPAVFAEPSVSAGRHTQHIARPKRRQPDILVILPKRPERNVGRKHDIHNALPLLHGVRRRTHRAGTPLAHRHAEDIAHQQMPRRDIRVGIHQSAHADAKLAGNQIKTIAALHAVGFAARRACARYPAQAPSG